MGELPAALPGKTGWPWTEETDPAVYEGRPLWPRISIVTPSFNQAQFLEETIRSVLLQNYPNLQYVVIDGGSTDGSVEIIKKYAPWIDFWVSEKDRGQSHAINKGLEHCSGHWFNWINSDDCLLPGALAAVGSAPRDAIMVSGAEVTGMNLAESVPLGRTKFGPTLEEGLVDRYICQQGVFFRTEEVKEAGGVREDLHYVMDYELIWCLALRHGAAQEIPDTLAFFRKHPAAKTTADHGAVLAEEARLLKGLLLRMEGNRELLARIPGDVDPASRFEARNLDRPSLEDALARRFWWNNIIEVAWRDRDFARFARETRRFLEMFPEAGGARAHGLRKFASWPPSLLTLISLVRSEPARAAHHP
jgi:glycosyltransferase involved in cell wall biosynthesis